MYLIEIFHGTPALSNKATLGDIQVELVHGVVDCLDLGDLEEGEEDGRRGEKGREGGEGGTREGGEREREDGVEN